MPRLTARHCRRVAVAAILLVFVTLALWWGLWTFAASQFHASIDGWIGSGRAAGTTITYDDRQSFGFPHRVVLRFTNVNWKDATGTSFHADLMDLSSLPWNHESFEAKFKGHAEISVLLDADNRTLTLAGDDGQAHVVLDPNGYWKFSRVELAHAQLGRAPDFLFAADHLEATADRAVTPPKDHTQPGLILSGEAENVVLPQGMPAPFGQRMGVLQASLRVMGDVPDFRRKDSVAVWNNDSGVVEFDNLHMEWGPLRLTAKGTLGFDDDLQPEGAFSSAIGNHEEVLKALVKQNFVPEHQAGMLNSALTLFAKPANDKDGIEVPITIQLGGLFLGPVRIFAFPSIEWPKAGIADGVVPAAPDTATAPTAVLAPDLVPAPAPVAPSVATPAAP